MADVYSAPIPGQSLTDEPRNYAWERPPEISDPNEAIEYHLNSVNKPEALDNVLELLQLGIPVKPLAKTLVTNAQMQGIHSVDVGLIVGKVLEEELISIAQESGIKFVMGDEEDKTAKQRRKDDAVKAMVLKRIEELEGTEEDDAGLDIMRTALDMEPAVGEGMEAPLEDASDELGMAEDVTTLEEEEPQVEQEAPVRSGLMARG